MFPPVEIERVDKFPMWMDEILVLQLQTTTIVPSLNLIQRAPLLLILVQHDLHQLPSRQWIQSIDMNRDAMARVTSTMEKSPKNYTIVISTRHPMQIRRLIC